ncbi:unnamed protein product [Bursaphelenchus okinawaensis]|uniref:Uncharacterized protein n=1 Tax=Bursaphelenchus okinawaensis TaxID=465554 RepID=A0A811LIM1_9BILA|nr:unnamed protein product [Bursaphelenchus okinawaensis]CAG9124375.1 unnamed protein product [Bursaphelenchus okinawaensis]
MSTSDEEYEVDRFERNVEAMTKIKEEGPIYYDWYDHKKIKIARNKRRRTRKQQRKEAEKKRKEMEQANNENEKVVKAYCEVNERGNVSTINNENSRRYYNREIDRDRCKKRSTLLYRRHSSYRDYKTSSRKCSRSPYKGGCSYRDGQTSLSRRKSRSPLRRGY